MTAQTAVESPAFIGPLTPEQWAGVAMERAIIYGGMRQAIAATIREVVTVDRATRRPKGDAA